ncbi:MAG: type II secretion system protein [Parcubacteria group bacterium]|nr:type II secretion system protein [Parcubacteria group bacterium]
MNYELRIKKFFAKDEKNLTTNDYGLKTNEGFTLVEMIVALGFFTVIMLVVISVLASVSGANEKARTMRVVIDNLNFAVENMARTLRVGSQYHCGSFITPLLNVARVCDDVQAGSEFIAFENIQSGGGTSAFQWREVGDKGFIERANNCASDGCPSANWNRITAPEIDVDLLRFYVKKPLEDDTGQAQILIIAKGTAGKGNVQTEFDIQTTVTQRLADS